MKPEDTRDMIIRKIKAAGFEPRAYSGRGMYGKYCLGVDLDSVADLATMGRLPKPSSDQMGLGIVIYWKTVPPPKQEAEARDATQG